MKLIQKAIASVAMATTATFTTFVTSANAATFTLPIEPAANATGVTAARDLFGLDGTGIKIGVISDSFNTSLFSFDSSGNVDNYATNIAEGYLPPGIEVLRDFPDPDPNVFDPLDPTDEGRALLQVIHAVAPGASLAFHAVPNDLEGFGEAIRALAAAGADIIVDDIGFFDENGLPGEPEPPEGPINQAITDVFNQGVAYFSAAGNDFPFLPIFGHPNNPAAAAVGAVYYGNQPLGNPPPSLFDGLVQRGELEPFSSAGNPNLPFLKPDFVAPDGLAISFDLPVFTTLDPNTGFFDFFGTSASVSFSAGVAALLLQGAPDTSPSEIYSVLRETAQPLEGQTGFNYRSGYGLIQADEALLALGVEPRSVPEPSCVPVFLALGLLGAGSLLKRHQQQKVLGKTQDIFSIAELETECQQQQKATVIVEANNNCR
jgi:hypothetical protein